MRLCSFGHHVKAGVTHLSPNSTVISHTYPMVYYVESNARVNDLDTGQSAL
jgi:hypothetical protein